MSVWQDPLVVSSQQEEDDLAKAIQLSLQENKVTLQLLYLKKTLRFLQLQNLNFGIAQLIFRAQARPHLPLRQMAVVPCIRWTALGI